MSIVTLKRKTQAQYKTQNNMGLEKKLTDCGENCAKSITGYVTTTGDQTITSGVKSFVVLPRSSAVPSRADELVNKLYVDNSISSVSGGSSSSVTLTGVQTITGLKTFDVLPQSSAVPVNTNDFVNKAYVDNSGVTVGTAQTITGLKTFGVLPQSSVAPSNVNDFVNRGYADNLVGLSFNLGLNGNTDISNNISYKNSTVRIASNGAYNLTVPLPTLSALANSVVVFQNDSSYKITLVSSAFQGKYGSNNTTLILPANTWVKLFSNGTNWLVNDRSAENQIYTLANFTIASNTIVSNFQYINSDLHLTSTYALGDTLLTIPEATATNSLNQIYRVFNDNCKQGSGSTNGQSISLSITSSYFKGICCDNAGNQTTLKIPPSSKVVIYSNGTNWIVNEYCNTSTVSTYQVGQAGNWTVSRPFPKTTIMNAGNSANIIVSLPTPIVSDVGTDILLIRGFSDGGAGGIYAGGSVSNPIFTNSTSYLPSEVTIFATPRILRCLVLQFGYAGSGSVGLTNGSTNAVVTGVVGGTLIHYNSVLTIPTTPATVQIKGRPSGTTAVGQNGTYILGTAFSGTTDTYTFTCNDTYFWVCA